MRHNYPYISLPPYYPDLHCLYLYYPTSIILSSFIPTSIIPPLLHLCNYSSLFCRLLCSSISLLYYSSIIPPLCFIPFSVYSSR
jgi:hypothetical protein